jgi:prepilin-type N-terminal cleavage/methylation domain-containing protein
MIDQNSSHPKTRTGFSLVEVLLALAIAAATAAAVVPELAAWRERGETKNVARSLQSLLQETRQNAFEDGTAWEFRIINGNEWSSAPVRIDRGPHGPGFSGTGSTRARQTLSGQLPVGYRAAIIGSQSNALLASSNTAGLDSLRFLPEGSATAARIIVRSNDASTCEIEIERLTGISRIVPEDAP